MSTDEIKAIQLAWEKKLEATEQARRDHEQMKKAELANWHAINESLTKLDAKLAYVIELLKTNSEKEQEFLQAALKKLEDV